MEKTILTKENSRNVCAIRNINDSNSEIEHFYIDENGEYIRDNQTIMNESEFKDYEIIYYKK